MATMSDNFVFDSTPPSSLRSSLEHMLSSAMICNVVWRSQSRMFDLNHWYEHCTVDTTFEDFVVRYVKTLGASEAEISLFRLFGKQADKLEAIVGENDELMRELSSSETNYLPRHEAPTIFNQLVMCIVCDRFLWSMEAELTPSPPPKSTRK